MVQKDIAATQRMKRDARCCVSFPGEEISCVITAYSLEALNYCAYGQRIGRRTSEMRKNLEIAWKYEFRAKWMENVEEWRWNGMEMLSAKTSEWQQKRRREWEQ